MIDSHCHMDLYPDPSQVAREALAAGIGTIVVTNLPSAFSRASPIVGNVKGIKLALGLHPLMAKDHAAELKRFEELVDTTCFIGEVGLDYSPAGYATREVQLRSFRFVLEALRGKQRFITLHSRRAEEEVLEILREKQRTPVVFHWYSGSRRVLKDVLADGHFVSVNPAMVESPNGQKIIESLPADRVLTESDGPFVRVHDRIAVPADVAIVESYLAEVWKKPLMEVRQLLKANYIRLRNQLGGLEIESGL